MLPGDDLSGFDQFGDEVGLNNQNVGHFAISHLLVYDRGEVKHKRNLVSTVAAERLADLNQCRSKRGVAQHLDLLLGSRRGLKRHKPKRTYRSQHAEKSLHGLRLLMPPNAKLSRRRSAIGLKREVRPNTNPRRRKRFPGES